VSGKPQCLYGVARHIRVLPGLAALLVACVGSALAQDQLSEFDENVIHYSATNGLHDPVAQLQSRLAHGKAKLEYDALRGYLPGLLRALNVPVSSQSLVFSKTSSQAEFTSPRTPRALYFADEVYVGWAPGAKVIDLAAVDPQQGPIFYTLSQNASRPPQFTRRSDCLQCHLGPKTINVPGLLVRSAFTAPDGSALGQVTDFVSGHNSPLEARWGGWYVTGTHAGMRHRGNIFSEDPAHPERQDLSAGANVTDLRTRFDTRPYLSADSDIVALLVLEHAVRMQNLITHASYETRCALAQGGPWAQARIEQAGELLLEYMLFRNEAPLRGQVKGTSKFASEFQAAGPFTADGRSLRQLDLRTRLFRFPCSYLVYSPSVDALPEPLRHYLWRRLEEVLTGRDHHPIYGTLTVQDRLEVLAILRETKPEFAAWLSHEHATDKVVRR
jgi:hypothetical protein